MLRKMVCMMLFLVLVASAVGCQQKDSTSEKDGGSNDKTVANQDGNQSKVKSIKVWMPPFGSDSEGAMDLEVWQQMTKPFVEETGVKVEIEIIPWSGYAEKYLTAITAGNGPDVGYMYLEMIADFIEMGALAPMTEYVTQEQKDNFLYDEKGIMKGEQYALPIVVGNARIMYYNKDILEANGITEIPTTWDAFVETCKQIESDVDGDGTIDIYPFIQQWNEPQIGGLNEIFYPYLWQSGGQIFDENGNFTVNSPEGLEAAQFLYDLRFKHEILDESVTSLSESDVIDKFLSGKVAFAVISTNKAQKFADAGINFDYITSLTNKQRGTFTAVDSLVMLESAEDKELTYQLISTVLKPEAMEVFHNMSPFAPITKDGVYMDDERFKRLYDDDSDALFSLPPVKGSVQIYEYLQKNLQLMMLGEMTPERALQGVEEYSKVVSEQ
ncbi:sugar ABC transporter substrate-binding protein [Vallitalea pronyensis]|uniref:Sugar ABC transporter substrate-binding protein n=1 Tax=Vallitalea pronyensis TaxID=1348613 RepID=A0A8J8SGI6_9FIRM|nr:sugar ABC transporter substrate-binding protein [Vallitalea pronyensis]QUI22810.1 sugar ABC transporter substrate-binding protein [Vallitalea pronyensis]